MNATVLGKKQSEKEWIERSWLMNIILFLCFVNFRNDFFYFCLAALAVLLVRMFLNRTPIVVSKMFFAVLLFGIVFAVFGGAYFYKDNGINGVIKLFLYPICFFIGENLVTGKREKSIHHLIYLLTFATATHGMLNFLKNLTAANNIGRNTYDVWTNQIWAATGQASLFVLLCGTIYYGLFLQEKKGMKLTVLILSAVMLVYNTLFLAGRFLFVALLVCVLIGLFLSVLGGKESSAHSQVRKKALIALIVMALLLGLFLIFWFNDTMGLRTLIENSKFFKRIASGSVGNMFRDESRTAIQKEYIRLIPTYPWGGGQMRAHTGFYGHDAFLSALNVGGIPAVMLLLAVFAGTLWQMWAVYRCKNISLSCRIWIISVYVACFALMAHEPVFEGLPWFAGGFLLLSGGVNALIKSKRQST
ncbi:MAG: hypothetical protein E7645_00275 [Ruminococcaceae bacterium]|nr:hypothetical protein [Oscillospiraceae bacterium]